MRKCALNQSKGKQVAYQTGKIIYSSFPVLADKVMQLGDLRKRKDCSLGELVMGGIFVFIEQKEDKMN